MKISKSFIYLVQLILIIAKATSSAMVSYRNSYTDELLNRIILNNNKSSMKYVATEDEMKKSMTRFLNKIIPNSGNVENVCNSKILQSNVQSKMRMLRSIISTCPGYCRLAMSQNGILYGSKNEFGLETIWKRVDIEERRLTEKNLGAFYIKFILSDKYLCINKDGNLFSSTFENNECLWLNIMPRLKSAKYIHLNVVINKNCNVNLKSTKKLSVYSNSYEASKFDDEENESCKSNINVTSGFSPDLQIFFRTCQTRVRQQVTTEKNPFYNIKNSHKLDLTFNNNPNKQNEFSQLDGEPNLEANPRFRKCYKYRKTSNYRKCMKTHYKCFEYNRDVEKLKKCRKKFGIKPISLPENKQPRMFYN